MVGVDGATLRGLALAPDLARQHNAHAVETFVVADHIQTSPPLLRALASAAAHLGRWAPAGVASLVAESADLRKSRENCASVLEVKAKFVGLQLMA